MHACCKAQADMPCLTQTAASMRLRRSMCRANWHLGGGALLHAERSDNRLRHALPRATDLEVLQRALRLRAPVPAIMCIPISASIRYPVFRLSLQQNSPKHAAAHISAGTSSGPKVSISVRVAGEEKCATPMTPATESAWIASVPVRRRYLHRGQVASCMCGSSKIPLNA